jgi:hypothetical protein
MFGRVLVGAAVLVMVASVGSASAQSSKVISVPSDSYGNVPMLADGRLNGFDLAAPAAVYYKYDSVTKDGLDYDVLRGIELLAIQKDTNNGQMALSATVAEITKAIEQAQASKKPVTIAQKNGYSLNYSPSGWFWVATPPDQEGKTYSFQWENLTIPVTGK